APHPLYRPNNDLVPCKDPLCAALHPPGDYKCESPDQCDYEVEYADGGSSLGVLVRNVFSLNYTNGVRLTLGHNHLQYITSQDVHSIIPNILKY
ncbi:Aspartic peptidase, partial [Corchorus olitorius]